MRRALRRSPRETGSAIAGRRAPRAAARRPRRAALRPPRAPPRSGRDGATRAFARHPSRIGAANRASARAYLQARVSLARFSGEPVYYPAFKYDRSMQRLMTRAWVEIDLGALVRNAERFARAAAAPLLPMVKADAYGLGAVRIAHALLEVAPWGFGVATVE